MIFILLLLSCGLPDESRLAAVEARLATIEQRQNEIDQAQIQLQAVVDSLSNSIDSLSASISNASEAENFESVPARPTASELTPTDGQPYIGQWCCGRGYTIYITSETIQFEEERPFGYEDITRVSDGSFAMIHLIDYAPGTFFQEYLTLSLNPGGEMEMTGYSSADDQWFSRNSGLWFVWMRL